MTKVLHVTVVDRVATYRRRDGVIVCGNSDYEIEFVFDEEWNDHPVKTARFIANGTYTDVVFEGTSVTVPVITNTTSVSVGVFAGNLRTTTPAIIECQKSILCDGGVPTEPTPDVYNQIMDMLNNGSGGGGGASATKIVTINSVFDVDGWSYIPDATLAEITEAHSKGQVVVACTVFRGATQPQPQLYYLTDISSTQAVFSRYMSNKDNFISVTTHTIDSANEVTSSTYNIFGGGASWPKPERVTAETRITEVGWYHVQAGFAGTGISYDFGVFYYDPATAYSSSSVVTVYAGHSARLTVSKDGTISIDTMSHTVNGTAVTTSYTPISAAMYSIYLTKLS